jgi:peptidyl-prolyl cis-trans isomerase SurA
MRSLLFLPLLLLFANRIDGRVVNGINAIVNEAVITYQEVNVAVASVREALVREYGRDPQRLEQEFQRVRGQALEELVEKQLILHEFKTAGYNLPESIVEDEIQHRIRQQFHDRVGLIKALQARGMTSEAFRQSERERIILAQMRVFNVSPSKILISPHKIESYYAENQDKFKVDDQVKLRMIVLNQGPDNPGAARKVAEEILKKIAAGASFAEMATVYSEGAERAQGGDRGWVDRAFLREELTQVAFSLKPGEHSGVVELPEACYLLQVEDTRSAHARPIEDVRDEIEATLMAQERGRLHKKWIDRLKNKSFIRYFF